MAQNKNSFDAQCHDDRHNKRLHNDCNKYEEYEEYEEWVGRGGGGGRGRNSLSPPLAEDPTHPMVWNSASFVKVAWSGSLLSSSCHGSSLSLHHIALISDLSTTPTSLSRSLSCPHPPNFHCSFVSSMWPNQHNSNNLWQLYSNLYLLLSTHIYSTILLLHCVGC